LPSTASRRHRSSDRPGGSICSDDIRVRVFVSGPGGDGYVDGDATGSMISINGN
jgi:hypothetical protein